MDYRAVQGEPIGNGEWMKGLAVTERRDQLKSGAWSTPLAE
jgi:hypothetical protein